MTVYIILPVYNNAMATSRFIQLLENQTTQDYHLLLIDDGSTDKTAELVTERLPAQSTIIKGNGRLWWAGSLQKAYEWLKLYAKSGHVLIINNDVIFNEHFLSSGIEYLTHNPSSLIQALNIDPDNGKSTGGLHFNYYKNVYSEPNNKKETNCLCTRGLLMDLKSFFDIGGFYPRLLPHYLSDYEYTLRAYRKGYKLRTFEGFSLEIDNKSTGIHLREAKSLKKFWEITFSKRYVNNPLYLTSYLFLVTPIYVSLYLVPMVWMRFFRDLLKVMAAASFKLE